MPDNNPSDNKPDTLPDVASIPDLRLIVPDHVSLPDLLITDLTNNPPSGTLIEPN